MCRNISDIANHFTLIKLLTYFHKKKKNYYYILSSLITCASDHHRRLGSIGGTVCYWDNIKILLSFVDLSKSGVFAAEII